MPGPGTHIIVSDKVVERLSKMDDWPYGTGASVNDNLPSDLADLAAMSPNYYALGAIGPDLFFFLPDFRDPQASPLIPVQHFVLELSEQLDEWILDDLGTYLGPAAQNAEELVSRVTGDLSTVVSDIIGSLSSVLINSLIILAAQSDDWFGKFSLGLNVGYDNQNFFWSDMLHYRKTSVFANSLWAIAEARAQGSDDDAQLWSDRLKAYALGYMTHLATDTAGHPFVNQKAGGPFRTHWQRHHLIENHIDAKTYDDEFANDPDYRMYTESALHYRIAFSEGGGSTRSRPTNLPGDGTLRGRYRRRQYLQLESEMPRELANLLFDAMDMAYDTSTHSGDTGPSRPTPDIIQGGDGRPEVETIQDTYLTLFRYLKISTLDGFSHEKPSPPELFPNLDFPLLTDPNEELEPPDEDEELTLLEMILAVIRIILWIVAVAIWLSEVIDDAVEDLETYPARLVAYYTIELPLFHLIKAQRAVMVMTGYFHPMQDEIDLGLIKLGNNDHGNYIQLLTAVDDILGTGLEVGPSTSEPVPDYEYPHQTKFEVNGASEEHHHPWDYPETPVEICPTFAGPWQSGDMPNILVDDNVAVNEELVERYSAAPTPFDTDTISFNEVTNENHMGDPVNFSTFLMWQLARPEMQKNVADWNLDSDRGYAYKCWDWNRDSKDLGSGREPQDTMGHNYLAPCTPPPQSKDMPHDSKMPLKLFYVDQVDPGCSIDVPCVKKKKKKDKHGKSEIDNDRANESRRGGRDS